MTAVMSFLECIECDLCQTEEVKVKLVPECYKMAHSTR